ncbi:hypothetical protein Tco_1259856 [Tanacetum coccineum]
MAQRRRHGVRRSLPVMKWTLVLALGVAWEKAGKGFQQQHKNEEPLLQLGTTTPSFLASYRPTITIHVIYMMASVDCNLDDAVPTTTEGGTCVDSDLNRNSWDPGWNFGTFCDATSKDTIKYKLCGFISKGGITRLKYHIARIQRKGVATCKKASVEDKAVCATLLEKPKEKRNKKESEKKCWEIYFELIRQNNE